MVSKIGRALYSDLFELLQLQLNVCDLPALDYSIWLRFYDCPASTEVKNDRFDSITQLKCLFALPREFSFVVPSPFLGIVAKLHKYARCVRTKNNGT